MEVFEGLKNWKGLTEFNCNFYLHGMEETSVSSKICDNIHG